MKVDMSPKAIENRLKLVGELTRACLLIRQNSKVVNEKELAAKKSNQKSKNTPPQGGRLFETPDELCKINPKQITRKP